MKTPIELKLQELLTALHNPSLATQPGMVYQVWEDGEITLQKSGDLLWRRNLHCIEMGLPVAFNGELFPCHLCRPGALPGQGRHGYIFTDALGAKQVREFIKEHGTC